MFSHYPRVAGVATEVHPKKLPQSCWGKVFMSSHRGAPKKNTPELLGSHQLVLIVVHTLQNAHQGEPVCTPSKIHTRERALWEPGCPFSGFLLV